MVLEEPEAILAPVDLPEVRPEVPGESDAYRQIAQQESPPGVRAQ
jgi:hypothetical protein